jgi:uncharacterized protein YukE
MVQLQNDMASKRTQLSILTILLVLVGVLALQRQAIADWARLYDYDPPATVSALATQDTMTAKAQHLFYVNHPQISDGKTLTAHCPAATEKTIVLGCYVGNDAGIYVYAVSDTRLNGVEQVTAAHEMLHAAYRRLSSGERTKVDAMLMDYYQHGLSDQRIKDTIDAYKKSEPDDLVNEMHSIFGTELVGLPAPLEDYYKQYFTSRSAVTSFAASYQAEFTSRQDQVRQYDAQLKEMKQQIDANNESLTRQKAALDAQAKRMQTERANGQVSEYNSEVSSYNQAADSYNGLLIDTRNLITQYNTLVEKRNAVALEEQQLSQELSASSLPASQ